MEIGNRKERLRVREAGASAAGRGQRPYASFPEWQPHRNPRSPYREANRSKNQGAKRNLIQLKTHRAANPVTPALGRAPQGG